MQEPLPFNHTGRHKHLHGDDHTAGTIGRRRGQRAGSAMPKCFHPKARNLTRGIILVIALGLALPGITVTSWYEDVNAERGSSWRVGRVSLYSESDAMSYSDAADSFCGYVDHVKNSEAAYSAGSHRNLQNNEILHDNNNNDADDNDDDDDDEGGKYLPFTDISTFNKGKDPLSFYGGNESDESEIMGMTVSNSDNDNNNDDDDNAAEWSHSSRRPRIQPRNPNGTPWAGEGVQRRLLQPVGRENADTAVALLAESGVPRRPFVPLAIATAEESPPGVSLRPADSLTGQVSSTTELPVVVEWQNFAEHYPLEGEVNIVRLCTSLKDFASLSMATFGVCIAFLCLWAAVTVVIMLGTPWQRRNNGILIILTATTTIACVPPLAMLVLWLLTTNAIQDASLETSYGPGFFLSFTGYSLTLLSIPVAILEYIYGEDSQRSKTPVGDGRQWRGDHDVQQMEHEQKDMDGRNQYYEYYYQQQQAAEDRHLYPAVPPMQMLYRPGEGPPQVGVARPKPLAAYPGNMDGARRAAAYGYGNQ